MKPYPGGPFELPPTAGTIHVLEPVELAYRFANRDNLNLLDLANDLKVHCYAWPPDIGSFGSPRQNDKKGGPANFGGAASSTTTHLPRVRLRYRRFGIRTVARIARLAQRGRRHGQRVSGSRLCRVAGQARGSRRTL